MTIWQADDRQGRKYFKHRPTFHPMHDIFLGERCYVDRPPRKGDRVMKNYTVEVMRIEGLRLEFPREMRVKPW